MRGKKEFPVELTSSGEMPQGSRIRHIRQQQGKSLAEVAESMGIHPASLTNIERNKHATSDNRLNEFCDEFKLSESDCDDLIQTPVHERIMLQRLAGKGTKRAMQKIKARADIPAVPIGEQIDSLLESRNLPQQIRELAGEIIVDFANDLCDKIERGRSFSS